MKIPLVILLLILLSACTTPSADDQTHQVQQEALDNPTKAEDEVEDYIPVAEVETGGDAMEFVVDGEQASFPTVLALSHTPVADYLTIVAPEATGIQLRMLPNSKGDYNTQEGPNAYRIPNVWFPWQGKRYLADANKGEAFITITEVGSMSSGTYEGDISGTFSGTFVADDGSEITVTKGTFSTRNNPE